MALIFHRLIVYFHPCTGIAPSFDDGVETYPIKIEGDEIFVGLEEEEDPHETTITDLMVETMVNWGDMFTGLWDAKVDRARILALTGQVDTQVVGTGIVIKVYFELKHYK